MEGIFRKKFAFTCVNPYFNKEIITSAEVSLPMADNGEVNNVRVRALWDTGATNSVITPHVAKALNVKPSGISRTVHAGGIDITNTYFVNIKLPNNVIVANVRVSECKEQAGRFDIIIGMDIISLGDFSITGQGLKRMVSFCLPSFVSIDYEAITAAMNKQNEKKDP